MGPLDDIYTINYTKNPAFETSTHAFDGSKWVTTTTSTSATPPGHVSWTGTSTSTPPPRDPSGKFIIPPVDLTKQIKDIHIQAAVVELLGADRVENVDEQIERINDAIKFLSEAVVKRLGAE